MDPFFELPHTPPPFPVEHPRLVRSAAESVAQGAIRNAALWLAICRDAAPIPVSRVDRLFLDLKNKIETSDRGGLSTAFASESFTGLSTLELNTLISKLILEKADSWSKDELFFTLEGLTNHPKWRDSTKEALYMLSLEVFRELSKGGSESTSFAGLLNKIWAHSKWSEGGSFEPSNPLPHIFLRSSYSKYLSSLIRFQLSHPENRIDFVKLLPLSVADFSIEDFYELYEVCKTTPSLKDALWGYVAGLEIQDLTLLTFFCEMALENHDEKALKRLFPFERLASLDYLDPQLHLFLAGIQRGFSHLMDSPSDPFRKVVVDLFKDLVRAQLKTPEYLAKMLYLQTFSKVDLDARHKFDMLGNSLPYLTYLYQLISLEDYRSSLSHPDPQLDKIISTLEASAFSAIASLSLFTPNYIEYQNHMIHEAEAMKPGEVRIFPLVIMASGNEGHEVKIVCKKEPDGNITIEIYDTSPFRKSITDRGKEKILPTVYKSLSLEQATLFLEFKMGDVAAGLKKMGILPSDEYRGITPSTLSPELLEDMGITPEDPIKVYSEGYRPFETQKINCCSYKSLSVWIHSQLSEITYLEYKKRSQNLLISSLRSCIETTRSRMERMMGPVSEESVLSFTTRVFKHPTDLVEFLILAEAETNYSASKEADIASIPLAAALKVAMRNPTEEHLYQILNNPHFEEITKEQLFEFILSLSNSKAQKVLFLFQKTSLYRENRDSIRAIILSRLEGHQSEAAAIPLNELIQIIHLLRIVDIDAFEDFLMGYPFKDIFEMTRILNYLEDHQEIEVYEIMMNRNLPQLLNWMKHINLDWFLTKVQDPSYFVIYCKKHQEHLREVFTIDLADKILPFFASDMIYSYEIQNLFLNELEISYLADPVFAKHIILRLIENAGEIHSEKKEKLIAILQEFVKKFRIPPDSELFGAINLLVGLLKS